ncbi:MAG: alpha-1,2-fucosyltransferase [Synergistaceae bacterium]|nr:alpha-1,2-fucosyltransferase [Synergistaceae bacterium]
MIVARITAGMGNQMFMYAAGLAAALRLNTELVLDTSSYGLFQSQKSSRKDRPYLLSYFPEITERKASFADTWKLSPGMTMLNILTIWPIKSHHFFRRLLRKALTSTNLAPVIHESIVNIPEDVPFPYPYKFSRIYIQNKAHDDKLKQLPDNTCLVGYWESEDYFADYADAVRRKFRFPSECFDPVLAEKVRSCNSVAVHVRRGDKVKEDDSQASNISYLKHAFEKIASLTRNPEFFVFSDDLDWCRENLRKAFEAEYNFIESQTPPQDMALMSICRHIIMAPSSFSWWGAWLNENEQKIIIAPKYRMNMNWHLRGAIIVE